MGYLALSMAFYALLFSISFINTFGMAIVKQKVGTYKSLWRPIGIAVALQGANFIDLHNIDQIMPSYVINQIVAPAVADSTGKFSTKLTARKRYFPRVVAGGQQLKDLVSNATPDKITAFLKDELPSLQRAMKLYGFSLRKGEYPDDISKKAEKLTEVFGEEASKLSPNKDNSAQLTRIQKAFDEYATFAKIEY